MPRSNDFSESSRLSSPCSMRETSCSSSSSDFSKSAIWDVSAAGMARTLTQRRCEINVLGQCTRSIGIGTDPRRPFEPALRMREAIGAGLADPEIGDRDERAVMIEHERQAAALPRRNAGFLQQIAELARVRAAVELDALAAAAKAHVRRFREARLRCAGF